MNKEAAVIDKIRNYYFESEGAYRNWGNDEERGGVYALHGGFAVEGQSLSHSEEVKELTRQLIKFAKIPPNSIVLDAGCGAGALAFELLGEHPDVKIVGINIAHNQLVSAENYRQKATVLNVSFSEQDYHYLAFPDRTFDVVIFCESYIHSYNKRGLAQEIYRVLKPSGRLVLSDTFLKRAPRDKKEELVLEELMRGWYLPSILKIKELESIWEKVGFSEIFYFYKEYTHNIIGSSRRMGEHAELRIAEGNLGSNVLRLSRKAAIACNKAFETGLTGYYFIKGGALTRKISKKN